MASKKAKGAKVPENRDKITVMPRKKNQLRLWPKTCEVPGCPNAPFTRGMCAYHWNRTDGELARSRAKRGTLGGKYSSLKRKAIRYGREISISIDEFAVLTVNRGCHYCGSGLPPMGHGLDRLDASKGYTVANCVPCCTDCNCRKGFLEAAGLLYPETVALTKRLIGKPFGKAGV